MFQIAADARLGRRALDHQTNRIIARLDAIEERLSSGEREDRLFD
ncbi:hypothetical protein [Erythrobacter sp. QSSC1-22B]|nr:hypothetical protein [Erythrobacter sp. QSSC1-22B]